MKNALILVVEDDRTGQYVLKELLDTFDYHAHVVSSGEEALAAIAVTNYLCVIMDIRLIGIDGFECTRQIRKLEAQTGNRRTPIIALTGETGYDTRALVVESGMDDYLCKPFDAEDLRKILLRYVYQPEDPNLKVLPPFLRSD